MSAGDFNTSGVYEANDGVFYSVKIQPETTSLTLNSTPNVQGTGTPSPTAPSAKVSGGRNTIGVNCRKVRFRFTGTVPDGYSGGKNLITLPVLTPAAFAMYGRNTTGTYTLGGVDYPVAYAGKTAEKVN